MVWTLELEERSSSLESVSYIGRRKGFRLIYCDRLILGVMPFWEKSWLMQNLAACLQVFRGVCRLGFLCSSPERSF